MIKVTHIQKTVRVLAALAYIALQSASVVHAAGHDVDAPVDTSCMLCKFAGHAPAVAPQEACILLPVGDVVADILPLKDVMAGVLPSYHAIRGPPSVS